MFFLAPSTTTAVAEEAHVLTELVEAEWALMGTLLSGQREASAPRPPPLPPDADEDRHGSDAPEQERATHGACASSALRVSAWIPLVAFAVFGLGCQPAPEPAPEPGRPELSVRVTPEEVRLPPGGEVHLVAEVVDLNGQVVFNRDDAPIVVNWRSTDPDAVTVDEVGNVTVRQRTATSLEAYIVGDTDEASSRGWISEEELREASEDPSLPDGSSIIDVNPEGELTPFTDLAAIWISPERVAMDIDEQRTFEVTAVDEMGAPTTVDCGEEPSISHSTYIDVTYRSTAGAEALDVTGLNKGFSVLSMTCAGFSASPVIVEVKPSVTLPDPSPSAQDSDFGLEPSLALHGERIHLTTYDQQHRKLVYTHFNGVWRSQFIDGEGDYGHHSKVLLDPLNNARPLACAWEGDGVTCWLQDEEGYWLRRRVDDTAKDPDQEPGPLRGVIDDEGVVHLLYNRSRFGAMVIATSREASRAAWNLEVVAPWADHGDLAIASDGEVRLAVRQGTAALFGHRDCRGPGWLFETIDVLDDVPPHDAGVVDEEEAPAPPGTYIQMVIGTDDRPQVVYYKAGNLVHAVRSSGEWRSGVIESVALGGPNFGLALDRRLSPRVSYFDETAERMRYASRKAGQWHIDSPTAETGIGRHSILVVDPYDRAQIAYYDDANQEAGFYVEPHFLDYAAVERGTPNPNQALVDGCSDPW